MSDAIFLSAGVPDPMRGPEYAKTADTVAITAAVAALVHVTLGRRLLVWGGQPAITPMIWVVAEALGLDYSGWVKLYQSRHFEDEFPEDNERFRNVTYTEDVEGDREKSLLAMRERMLKENTFRSRRVYRRHGRHHRRVRDVSTVSAKRGGIARGVDRRRSLEGSRADAGVRPRSR